MQNLILPNNGPVTVWNWLGSLKNWRLSRWKFPWSQFCTAPSSVSPQKTCFAASECQTKDTRWSKKQFLCISSLKCAFSVTRVGRGLPTSRLSVVQAKLIWRINPTCGRLCFRTYRCSIIICWSWLFFSRMSLSLTPRWFSNTTPSSL